MSSSRRRSKHTWPSASPVRCGVRRLAVLGAVLGCVATFGACGDGLVPRSSEREELTIILWLEHPASDAFRVDVTRRELGEGRFEVVEEVRSTGEGGGISRVRRARYGEAGDVVEVRTERGGVELQRIVIEGQRVHVRNLGPAGVEASERTTELPAGSRFSDNASLLRRFLRGRSRPDETWRTVRHDTRVGETEVSSGGVSLAWKETRYGRVVEITGDGGGSVWYSSQTELPLRVETRSGAVASMRLLGAPHSAPRARLDSASPGEVGQQAMIRLHTDPARADRLGRALGRATRQRVLGKPRDGIFSVSLSRGDVHMPAGPISAHRKGDGRLEPSALVDFETGRARDVALDFRERYQGLPAVLIVEAALQRTRLLLRRVVPKRALASASEALKDGGGDCTEHAVVVAALCRSAGVHTSVRWGLVHQASRREWRWHSWCECRVDRGWIVADSAMSSETGGWYIDFGSLESETDLQSAFAVQNAIRRVVVQEARDGPR